MVDEGRVKMSELNHTLKTLDQVTNRLQMQHQKAQQEIAEAYQFYLSMLEETKMEFLKELDDIFNSRMVSLTLLTSKVEEAVRKTEQISLFVDQTRKFASAAEMVQYKSVIDSKLQAILNFNPDANIPSHELEFVSNYQAIQVGIRNTFGSSVPHRVMANSLRSVVRTVSPPQSIRTASTALPVFCRSGSTRAPPVPVTTGPQLLRSDHSLRPQLPIL